MTRDFINKQYFDWMYTLVCDGMYSSRVSYRTLLCYLHHQEFVYSIGMDGNRAEDGINLRYRFAYECNYRDAMIAAYLDDRPCSILEMMVALAIRCEEHIMDDPDLGNRTGRWFWDMIDSLGLGTMSDSRFNTRLVDEIIDRFLNREYKPNGEGGLFTVENSRRDMRDVEIWYQMCWYLNTV